MVKGIILEKGERYYTFLRTVFSAIENIQMKYNWLITDCDCIPRTDSFAEMLHRNNYCFLSGKELTAMIEAEDFQWIWAVLSRFDKSIPLEEVLKYELPFADAHVGFWKNPVSIQHPLADIEIVPWDSSLTLIISKDDGIINNFRKAFPLSEDLAEHNAK